MSFRRSHPAVARASPRRQRSRNIALQRDQTRDAEYRAWKAWDASRFGQFGHADALAFRAEFKRAGIPFDRHLSVLEIGFGNGAFAGWVAAQGWTFVGTERDPQLVESARKSRLEAYPAETSLQTVAAGRKFDVIAAFDVLEHLVLSEIEEVLAAARMILAPGGRFIARFPSGDSPFSRAIQYGDLTHKSVIGTGIVIQLARRTGFRALQIRAPAFPILGAGVWHGVRRLGVRAVQLLVTRLVNLGFHDNQPRVVTANMVAVLVPDGECGA